MIRMVLFGTLAVFFCFSIAVGIASAQSQSPAKPRARDLGVPFDGTPGPLNAITDVSGVTVGHTTLISGEGKLQIGKGPVRTGVTAVLPRGKDSMNNPVFAGWWSLNDINGFHVKPEDAFHAIDSAHSGAVEEGNAGGGTGMICNEFKGGIGTASRKLDAKFGGYTVGVLVQCNYGVRPNLRIAGVPVGKEISQDAAYASAPFEEVDRGSIIVVVDTDAPLLSQQLKRLARRVSLGLGRNGSISGNGSGDIFIAFSTPNPHA